MTTATVQSSDRYASVLSINDIAALLVNETLGENPLSCSMQMQVCHRTQNALLRFYSMQPAVDGPYATVFVHMVLASTLPTWHSDSISELYTFCMHCAETFIKATRSYSFHQLQIHCTETAYGKVLRPACGMQY